MVRPAPYSRALVLAAGALAWCWSTGPAYAQRVEFPTALPQTYPPLGASAVYPPTPQPALPAPAAVYDPYATPGLGTPPIDVPYAAPGSSPLLGGPIGPAPTYGSPYPVTTPNGSGALFQNMPTPRWGRGAGYDYQNSDGTVARLQRFLQQLSFEHTWLAGDHGFEALDINRTELAATFGVPIFYNPDTPLLITPGFAFNWLEGPIEPFEDLPPRVYDAYLDAAWHPRFTDWFSADLGVRTGVWTDFHAVNSDSIRVLGRGLGVLSLTPRMDLLAGVWYLDRNRIKLLPAGGIHWRPSPEWDAFLVFPNPKVRKRFVNIGSSQWWWYFAGEYGGGRWTVEGFFDDEDIDINDIRVIAGLEWETPTQARGHVEVGYVFDREVYFSDFDYSRHLDDTVMIRAGVDF